MGIATDKRPTAASRELRVTTSASPAVSAVGGLGATICLGVNGSAIDGRDWDGCLARLFDKGRCDTAKAAQREVLWASTASIYLY